MAANEHLVTRLSGIRKMLMGAHQAGQSMSAATKGTERAAFVDNFLREILTPQFRFGDGDATDRAGARSGQLDVVVEYPWVPSLPIVGSNRPRLYLAEGVAAVIEVKSDVAGQWEEVKRTSEQLKKLQRQYGSGIISGFQPPRQIPLFAVGYTGWKTLATVQEKVGEGVVEGVLVLEAGIYVSSPTVGGVTAIGDWSLWGFISDLHQITSALSSLAAGVPIQYALP